MNFITIDTRGFQDLIFEIRRIGNNINQIARAVNQSHLLSLQQVKELQLCTVMTAVYWMLHLDAPVPPLFEGKYDIRMVKAAFNLLNDKETEEFTVQDLPKVNPLKLKEEMVKLVSVSNEIPKVLDYYQEKWENQ